MIVLISSPSGGGKNTIIRELMKIYPDSCLSVNTTSRIPREKEKHGVDYFFISKKEFEDKIERGEFIEHNFYNGNYYGVEKRQLQDKLKQHKIVFMQIDVNGKKSFDREKIKHLSFFLIPDDIKNLEKRIKNRGGLSEKQIEERLNTAKKELKQAEIYDYQIVNRQGKLENTISKIKEKIEIYLSGLDK